jgi:nucleoside-diphosphate-sugar epimerase
MRILITDANGFVGRALCREARGAAVRGVTRAPCDFPIGAANVVVGSIDGSTDWLDVLADCEVVVHLAARVHVLADAAANPLAEFRWVNMQDTLNLARHAAAAGVRRCVFVSSIMVYGEAMQLGQPFTADDAPAPLDAYGVSKMEAEHGLREIARQTGIEVVIIRPPLVYGP